MTTVEHRPHSVPAMPLDLRLAAIGRRVSTSGALAIVLSEMAFGTRQRDHAEALHFATHARVADAVGVRS